MNREDIIRMAREAGMTVCRDEWVFGEMLERFADLVATAEREAIEKQLTQKEKDEIERNKKIALAKLAELRRQYKGEA